MKAKVFFLYVLKYKLVWPSKLTNRIFLISGVLIKMSLRRWCGREWQKWAVDGVKLASNGLSLVGAPSFLVLNYWPKLFFERWQTRPWVAKRGYAWL
jgi:hypothetical protein